MLLISPRPIVDNLASPNSCRFHFSSTTLQQHQRACTDTAFLARSVSGPLLHSRSLSSSFRSAPPPSPSLHRSSSSIPLPLSNHSSTKQLKRGCPDTPASPAHCSTFERQRSKAQRISTPGSEDSKAVQTKTTGAAKVYFYGQGEERRGCGAGKKEFGQSSAHAQCTTFRQGQLGQTYKAQLHRLRLIKGMSTSTDPGRARPRLSLSLSMDTASAHKPSTGTAATASPYNPDPVQDTMSSSPVTIDTPPSVYAIPSYVPPSSTSPYPDNACDSFQGHCFTQPALMKRPNPKRLSLSLTIPPTPTHAIAPSASTFTTPAASEAASTAIELTPYTPGPPMTPAMPMSLGRAATKSSRRPNLMSLITQPPVGNDVPPTPSAIGSSPFSSLAGPSARTTHPFATMRDSRRRSNTAEEQASAPVVHPFPVFRSAYPRTGSCDPIFETDNGSSTPSTTTTHSRTDSGVTSTSTSISNPAASRMTAYANGPVELVPGVYLGAEESMLEYHTWASTSRVRILNVAQELDDPWMHQHTDRKGKGKAIGAFYPADAGANRPDVEYRHLLWSHGEAGLAEIDETMDLGALIDGREIAESELERESWRFWEAIRWVEEGRRRGERVLIHCQCGISRSATLSVAYLMALAATGSMPEQLGHLTGMQDTYAFVKAKSSCIGPNVSLVFQLVDFARNLTTLLEKYISANPNTGSAIQTSFPKTSSIQQSEADWARQRAAFDHDEEGCEADQEVLVDDTALTSSCNGSGRVSPASSLPAVQGMSIKDMQREAEALDEAMRQRRLRV